MRNNRGLVRRSMHVLIVVRFGDRVDVVIDRHLYGRFVVGFLHASPGEVLDALADLPHSDFHFLGR